MGEMSGRKNLVWVTHGVPIAGYSIEAQMVLDFTNPLRGFCERLAQAQIVVYTVAQSLSGVSIGTPSIQTLQQFSEITGGREYGSDRAGDAIQQAITDSRANYEIAYYSAAPNPDGKHHKVRVVCERKDVRLQTEEGFYALAPASGSPATALQSRELPLEIATAAHSPFDATQIGLRASVSRDPRDSQKRRFEVHIDAADLLPCPARDPDAGKVFVAFVAYDQWQKPLAEPALSTLTPEQFEAAKGGEITLSDAIPVPQGIPKVRLIVVDAELGTVGSLTIRFQR